MNYVGIDFSLNSPGICIHKSQSDEFTWVSITRSDRTQESLQKTKDKPFAILGEIKNFELIFNRRKEFSENYTQRETEKILFFSDLADEIMKKVEELSPGNSIFAMEGLSFSSNGNSLIDISMATAILRSKIISKYGPNSLLIFSPAAIKKYACKGNAKKDQMYDALIEKHPDNIFSNLLNTNRNNWITPKLQINKPIDDLVDATWITLFLKDTIEGNLKEIETKKKKTIKKNTKKQKIE
jgi:hypothetical protein